MPSKGPGDALLPALARPTILGPEAQAARVEALAGGAFLNVACAAAGVPYRSFRR